MLRKLLIISFILAISSVVVVIAIHASSSTAVFTLNCIGWAGDGVPDTVIFDRDNTGTGEEAYLQQVTDGAGTIHWQDAGNTVPLGSYFEPSSLTPYTTAPQYNPLTIIQVSLAGNGFPEQVLTVQTGSCDGLPTFVSPDTCLQLTANAVVGQMASATQAYWAPGKISPDVVINAGTYWVLGTDSSGQYYKILLACQYLWVPVDSMQPSFQLPWNGQPLPTTDVE